MLLATIARAENVEYSVVDLGRFTQVAAMNAVGDVVGTMRTANGKAHAFLYTHGRVLDLGTLGGDMSLGAGINASGTVVGTSVMPETGHEHGLRPAHALLYTGGVLQDLTIQEPREAISIRDAYDINDSGQIAGSDFHMHAVLYSKQTVIKLGSLTPDGYSVPRRINARGEIVGMAKSGDGHQHAFLYSNGRMIDLGTLGGSDSHASDINASGTVVGWSKTAGGGHAFLYSNGTMHDLGVPPGSRGSGASAINSLGQIVGDADIPSEEKPDTRPPAGPGVLDRGIIATPTHVFLYDHGQWIDLDKRVDLSKTALREMFKAEAINDAGQIAGQAMGADGYHGFLLTPKPVSGN